MLFNKKPIKLFLISIFGIVFTIVLISIIYFSYFLNSNIEKPMDIVIKKGTTKFQVLEILCIDRCSDFIRFNILRAYLYFNPNIVIEAGTYSIKENDSFIKVLNNFKNGTKQIKITFLPGWSVEENAYELKKVMGAEFAKNYYLVAKKDQGYLYPDTYFLDQNTSVEQLIKNQKDAFNNKSKLYFTSNSVLSSEQKIIIASIVQREALGTSDNKIISGILTKRFLEGMPLDADATNQYAVFLNSVPDFSLKCLENEFCNSKTFEFWKKNLTDSDLKIDSPFNTRGKVGLPPYPISNPSVTSIEAAMKPEDTSYYYYLHDSKGNTYYAKTLEEHIANINKYL